MQELSESEGYKEAVEIEKRNRLLAFADVSKSVYGGFEILPITLYHYDLLRIAESPLLRMDIPTPSQLKVFLWLTSRWYKFRNVPLVRRLFYAKCNRVFSPRLNPKWWQSSKHYAQCEARKLVNTEKILCDVFDYIAKVFQDSPKIKSADGSKSFYDVSASIVGTIARNYGWKEKDIRKTPVARLLQYKRECLEYQAFEISLKNKRQFVSPLDNPSDAITMRRVLEFGKSQAQSSN